MKEGTQVPSVSHAANIRILPLQTSLPLKRGLFNIAPVERSMTAKKWLDRVVYLSSMGLSALINRKRDPKQLVFRRILCIKEDEIGDLVLALPVFEMLRLQYPDAHITLLCRPFGQALLKYSPHLNRVVCQYDQLETRYDLLIDLRGTPASTRFALFHPPSYRLDRGTIRYHQRKRGHHPSEAETYRELLQPLLDPINRRDQSRIFIGPEEEKAARQFLHDHGLKKFALFHTGARRMLKKWPLERMAEVMNLLQQEYGLSPVLVGDAEDARDAESLKPLLKAELTIAAGKVSLLVFAALCREASFFLGNDSGPLHIAAAMGNPALGLFGPGDPVFHPLQSNAGWIHHVLECNPCDQVHCKYPGNPCIRRISVTEVQEKIGAMLGA